MSVILPKQIFVTQNPVTSSCSGCRRYCKDDCDSSCNFFGFSCNSSCDAQCNGELSCLVSITHVKGRVLILSWLLIGVGCTTGCICPPGWGLVGGNQPCYCESVLLHEAQLLSHSDQLCCPMSLACATGKVTYQDVCVCKQSFYA